MAINSNRELIVSGSSDETKRCWRASTGEAVDEPLCCHDYYIGNVAISEDDKCIASGSGNGEIRAWNGLSGVAIGPPF